MFKLFFEVQYHSNKPDLNRIFPESVHDCSALHVCSFILSILHQGIFSVSAFIVSVIYLSRFKESSHITLHACTWRPLFLTSLLLADKMWEDKPVRNSSLAKLFPVLNNAELNKMESEFLGEIRFNVLVKPDLFCSFCEKLLAEQVHQEITRCVNQSEYAATLQADHVESPQPVVKSQSQQTPGANSGGSQKAASEVSTAATANPQPTLGNDDLTQLNGQRFDLVPAAAPWPAEAACGKSVGSTAVGHSISMGNSADSGVPRSQSAGPPTGAGCRRASDQSAHVQPQANVHSQCQSRQSGTDNRSQPLHTLMSLRGGSVGGSVSGGSASKSSSTTPQPPRSISVHPLHRNESIKKHSLSNKVEDASEKQAVHTRPGQHHHVVSHAGPPQHQSMGGPPLRRSLPAKTSASAYSPLSRVPLSSGGAGSASTQGISGVRDSVAAREHTAGASLSATPGGTGSVSDVGGASGGSVAVGGHQPTVVPISVGASGAGSRQTVPQTSPRSPGAGHYGHEQGYHQQFSQQSYGHGPPRASSQVSQQHHSHGMGQGSMAQQSQLRAQQATRVNPANTPPVPMTSHSVPPGGQGAVVAKAMQSRGTSPAGCGISGGGSAQQQQLQQQSGQQPARASSAPRASGIASAAHSHHTTPPSGSTMRTTSQPMQAGGYNARATVGAPSSSGGHVPGSPSPPMVVFPSTPSVRGSSPGPQGFTVAGSMPMNSGRGHHHVVMPSGGQMPFGGSSVSGGHRPDILSTTRGRSPPPTLAGTAGPSSGPTGVRQPRAVTPGALVKGIQHGMQQGMQHGGNIQRSSFGQPSMMVHRGM